MRRIFITLCLGVTFFNATAQDDSTTSISENFNEIKLNALYGVLGVLDLTYERTLTDESAIGLTFVIPFDETLDTDLKYYFSPYFRYYFGKKYAAGFFMEGFGLISGYEQTEGILINDVIVIRENNKTAFALGIGLGGKWVTNGGFVGELSLGIGKNLINADNFVDDVVAKVGIGIGYRF